MEHKLIITLPDEVFVLIAEDARRSGRTPEEEAARLIERSAPKPTRATGTNSTHSTPDPLERHFGAWNSGDPNSADNERIDADLAREYGSSHEDER
ncbi:MAG TPA: hypothetical protein VM866_02420 [Pyrinomonadaceae bacterium]|jgi:hypothetical protein|nr:hypothetical protein [Pyrinomonadaceae bacterium]